MRHFDHADVVAECICPRPLLVVAPTLDVDMLAAGVEQLKAHVGPAYAAAGAGERFEVEQPTAHHEFTTAIFER